MLNNILVVLLLFFCFATEKLFAYSLCLDGNELTIPDDWYCQQVSNVEDFDFYSCKDSKQEQQLGIYLGNNPKHMFLNQLSEKETGVFKGEVKYEKYITRSPSKKKSGEIIFYLKLMGWPTRLQFIYIDVTKETENKVYSIFESVKLESGCIPLNQ